MNKSMAMMLATALLLGLPAHAQDAAAVGDDQAAVQAEVCAKTQCQHDLRITLRQKDGATYDRTFPVYPGVVQAFGLTVVAGQTIHVEAEMSGDKLVGYRAVEVVEHAERTLTATLEQDDEGGMMLTLANPFPKALKFNMGMMPLDVDTLHRTSSCPVIAGGKSFETWPFPIFQVVLANARLLELGDSMACVE
jgi:hypothetical protein